MSNWWAGVTGTPEGVSSEAIWSLDISEQFLPSARNEQDLLMDDANIQVDRLDTHY
jgi:hypothetical protein